MASFLRAVVFLLVTLFIESVFSAKQTGVFSVLSYGAVGDGKADDSPAFVKAWEAACNSVVDTPKLFVPRKKIFMLTPLSFEGPCKSPTISVMIQGTLVAPPVKWDVNRFGSWISFSNVLSLVIGGSGTIDGRGQLWWGQCGKSDGLNSLHVSATPNGSPGCEARPTAMHFQKCDGLKLMKLNSVNPPRNHIGINGCKNVNVDGLTITAPGDSPNTDGINVQGSIGVNIHDTTIATGDDCVAVSEGSAFVNVTRVFCGPGHGISIGSLGGNGDFDAVEEVHVNNCTFTETTNGMRIKTYQHGDGYARKISFENIILVKAKNPIIIDQYYEDDAYKTSNGKGNGVKVSDVTYSQVNGTSASENAITLNCNAGSGCNNIVLNQVSIVPALGEQEGDDTVVCNNAHGSAFNVRPIVACLQ